MGIIIKNDDDNNSQGSVIKSHSISVTEDCLLLVIVAEDFSVSYRISADSRATNLSEIKDFIENELKDAYSNKKPFLLTEYLERCYIFIGDIDSVDGQRQFSASAI